jgi:hypothetical protein
MVAMVDVVAVYLVEKGLWTLFHLKFARHIKLDTVEMVVETEVLELMEMTSS